ncbi:MAG: DNA replication/repair protein RecF [Gammaproteobacteria bacterium]|nr:DNA replication/repair protein RecF [Gammaproteobacteria bacterium]
MPLEKLKISSLRNISDANFGFSKGINVIAGPNASGKTSLLEAISLLCRGRSFRTSRVDQLIQHNHEQLLVVGEIRDDGRLHVLGYARENKKSIVKLDGSLLSRSTDLIALQALHVITPESHEILEQGPKMRRQYLDWGVFHVKPGYLACWQRYHRVLRQRNHVLRQGGGREAVQAWDKPLLDEATALHSHRLAYLESLTPALSQYGQLLLEMEVEFRYRPGWNQASESFAQQLRRDFAQDQERGFTQSGPHRADIHVTINGHSVRQILSRGQQKLLVCTMYLAQVASAPRPGILLIDDLPAELDPIRREKLISAAADTGAQLFVTATESNLLPVDQWKEKKVFHVEHGQFHEVV